MDKFTYKCFAFAFFITHAVHFLHLIVNHVTLKEKVRMAILKKLKNKEQGILLNNNNDHLHAFSISQLVLRKER